jgi:acyl carrier protein
LPGPSPIAEPWTHAGSRSAYAHGSFADDLDDYDPDPGEEPGGDGFDDYDGEPPSADHVADVLEVVQDMLVDVIGPEYLIDLTIGLDTAFDGDLELESLEFVALAEQLLQHYGGQVDFVAWLATMELDEIIALSVGDLVSFIVASTTGVSAHP